jgi:hypothetical protein
MSGVAWRVTLLHTLRGVGCRLMFQGIMDLDAHFSKGHVRSGMLSFFCSKILVSGSLRSPPRKSETSQRLGQPRE